MIAQISLHFWNACSTAESHNVKLGELFTRCLVDLVIANGEKPHGAAQPAQSTSSAPLLEQ